MQYSALLYLPLQCSTVHCSHIPSSTVQCRIVQRSSTVWCSPILARPCSQPISLLQCSVYFRTVRYSAFRSVVQGNAVQRCGQYSSLEGCVLYSAVLCSVQCSAAQRLVNTWALTALRRTFYGLGVVGTRLLQSRLKVEW